MRRVWWPVAVAVALGAGFGTGWRAHQGERASSGPSARRILYYRSPMNAQQTSPAPTKDAMGMDFVPVYSDEGAGPAPPGAVRIDATVMQNTGVRIEEVQRRSLARHVRTVGTVTYDERRLYSVNLKFMGWVDKLYADYTGKWVRRGEPLVDVYSPDVVTTEEELAATARSADGDHLVQRGKRRLRFWDVPESQVDAVLKEGAKRTVTILSPVDGFVVEKNVVQGMQAPAGMQLFKLADLSTLWVIAQVYPRDLPWVRMGQKATVELSYLPERKLEGTVGFIGPSLNPDTRTAQVRIELSQPQGEALRPDMFATVDILVPPREQAVVMPERAVLHSGERTVAIVSLGEGLFAPREVRLGVSADGDIEVLQGLSPGDRIVTSSEFLIDSESNLRAALAAFQRPAENGSNDGGSGP